jgi:hypothetical protein
MANREVHSTPPRPAAVAAAVLDSAAEDAAVATAAERVPAVAINPVAAVTGPAAATVPAVVQVHSVHPYFIGFATWNECFNKVLRMF